MDWLQVESLSIVRISFHWLPHPNLQAGNPAKISRTFIAKSHIFSTHCSHHLPLSSSLSLPTLFPCLPPHPISSPIPFLSSTRPSSPLLLFSSPLYLLSLLPSSTLIPYHPFPPLDLHPLSLSPPLLQILSSSPSPPLFLSSSPLLLPSR